LENDDFAVIIENKTESSDHYKQLSDYDLWLKNNNDKNKKLQLVYLTYYDSDKANHPTDDLRHLSYKTDIIKWLETIAHSNIPEYTRIAIMHYCNFLKKLLNIDYMEICEKIVKCASHPKNSDKEREIKKFILQNPYALLPDTIQRLSEGLCIHYCTELLKPFGISLEQISVSEVSLDGSSKTPFRCVCTFSNGNSLEFLPIAPNKRNYGKLYAFSKERKIIIPSDPMDIQDKMWDCNIFAWLYGDDGNETPLEWVPKNDISLANCIAVCHNHNN